MKHREKSKGILTVEALCILPVFILVMFFVLNIMNVFYFHLVMQQALNNTARVLAQYGYVIDHTIGFDSFRLDEETKETEADVIEGVQGTVDSVSAMVGEIEKGFSFSTIQGIIEKAKGLQESLSRLGDVLSKADDGQIVNYLFVSAMNMADDKFLEWMIGDYLTQMQVNQDSIADLEYRLYVEKETDDIVLVARYGYRMCYFIDTLWLEQTARVHPWIGSKQDKGKE